MSGFLLKFGARCSSSRGRLQLGLLPRSSGRLPKSLLGRSLRVSLLSSRRWIGLRPVHTESKDPPKRRVPSLNVPALNRAINIFGDDYTDFSMNLSAIIMLCAGAHFVISQPHDLADIGFQAVILTVLWIPLAALIRWIIVFLALWGYVIIIAGCALVPFYVFSCIWHRSAKDEEES